MQLVDRWEKVMEAQPTRQFRVGAIMGNDGIELWTFSRDGQYKRTGITDLLWEEGNIGWQVRKWQLLKNTYYVTINIRGHQCLQCREYMMNDDLYCVYGQS